jgi:hypothetical protein
MNTHVRRPHSEASLLMECLIYMAVLIVILTVAYSAFFKSEQAARGLQRTSTDISRSLQAGERWRDDIRAADGLPEVLAGDGGVAFFRIPSSPPGRFSDAGAPTAPGSRSSPEWPNPI